METLNFIHNSLQQRKKNNIKPLKINNENTIEHSILYRFINLIERE